MSSCLVLQAKDKLYIGADTSSSVFIDDKLYRLNNNTKKLFLLDNNTVLYCAGNNLISNGVSKYIASIYRRDDFSLTTLKNWLIEKYPYRNNNKTIYDVEILIATFKDRKTIVYQMSQYKNYDIISFEVSDAGVQILSAGIKNAECMSFAENELLNKSDVKSIFRTTFNNLSCNYIGGYLDLYEISKNGAVKIFDNEKINEHGIQYVHDVFNGLSVSLNAEVLVSKLVMSENLWIENQSGTYKFDDAGFIASSGKNSVRIQPNKSGELFSIYKGNNKQFYVDSDGNVHFTGDLTGSSGIFSGQLKGGSINIGNNTFTVDKDGHMIASSGTFGGLVSGGSININDNFVVDSSGRITANVGTFGGLVSGGSININDNFTVDKYGNMIAKSGKFSGDIIGGSININNNFTVDKYGNMIAKSGNIAGWKIEYYNNKSYKLYGGDENTGIAAMQVPGDNMLYVFAAGGRNHNNYGDCPFRVTKYGALYAKKGKISEFNITDKGLEWDNYGTKIWANTLQTSYITATASSTVLDIGEKTKTTYIYGKKVYVNDNEVTTNAHLEKRIDDLQKWVRNNFTTK